MCTGRVDLSFILRAFSGGADGVFIGGCWPGECHYVTEGNYDALANMHLCRKLMAHLGIAPERLRLEWISASEGSRFAEVMNDFGDKLRALGPLFDRPPAREGAPFDRPPAREGAPGANDSALQGKLEAASKLVPYIKLVERERLRAPTKTEEAYNAFYASDEVNRLFDELIVDKLAISQIMLLLKDKPLSTIEIAEQLSLNPSDVSRHMNASSRQGLVKYDVDHQCYALAR
jgi:F420-non-reducing hydrogenase iron-sulfur subunit